MTLRNLSTRHGVPLVAAKEQHATVVGCLGAVVHKIAFGDSRCAVAVDVRTIGIVRTEHTHLIAAITFKSAVAHEEEVVRTDLLNVACLARHIVATGYLLAEVGVACGVGAGSTRSGSLAINLVWELIGVVAQTVGLVEFQHKDAARP